MILIRNIAHLVTFDQGQEIEGADVLVDGRVIAAVGRGLQPPAGCEIIDGTGHLATPGLVNAHHHLYQVPLRAIPDLERAAMGPWLAGIGARTLRWFRDGALTPETVADFALAGLVESQLTGTTTVADQHYFHPAGRSLPFVEHVADAAARAGVRFHAARGTLTLGQRDGAGAADAMVQDLDEVLRHCQELIERHHDPQPLAMTRVALAPCGVHTDGPDTFTQLAQLAAEHPGVRLHTHLYEQVDGAFARERYGCTPWEFLERTGWAGERTWLAHVVDVPAPEIARMASAGVGVAHLIAPDLRMGFGLAPIRAMLDAGVTLGFGTTGSASNDGSNMLGDLRLAALAHRIGAADPAAWPSARELLYAATRGSALCLGRDDIGVVAPGFAADIALWDTRRIDRVGVHDPVAGLLLTGFSDVASLVVANGAVVVRGGRHTRVDEEELVARCAGHLTRMR